MISIKVSASQFAESIDAELAKISAMVDGTMRGLAVEAYGYLLRETPQWSGNAAANWTFNIGSPDTSVDHTFKRQLEESDAPIHLSVSMDAMQKGDMEAIKHAISRNAGRELGVTVLTPVFLSNSATNLSGDSYMHMLELNPNNFLRQENSPGHMVSRAVVEIEGKYSVISAADVKRLSAKRISGLAGGSEQLGLFG